MSNNYQVPPKAESPRKEFNRTIAALQMDYTFPEKFIDGQDTAPLDFTSPVDFPEISKFQD